MSGALIRNEVPVDHWPKTQKLVRMATSEELPKVIICYDFFLIYWVIHIDCIISQPQIFVINITPVDFCHTLQMLWFDQVFEQILDVDSNEMEEIEK